MKLLDATPVSPRVLITAICPQPVRRLYCVRVDIYLLCKALQLTTEVMCNQSERCVMGLDYFGKSEGRRLEPDCMQRCVMGLAHFGKTKSEGRRLEPDLHACVYSLG